MKQTFSDRFSELFRRLLPAPFTIAVLLTILAFALALAFTRPHDVGLGSYTLKLASDWEDGLWNSSLLVFAVQMMLMLVLGHVLALTRPVDQFISSITRKFCHDTASAAFAVTFLTVCVALFNWGLGLVFGAIFARKVGEHARKNHFRLNYPLIGAAGYSGLMVWHGGFSGSSLAKVAEQGHLQQMMNGVLSENAIAQLPESISYTETVFGFMNIVVSAALLVILPLFMWFLGKKSDQFSDKLPVAHQTSPGIPQTRGAERLDYASWLAVGFGSIILFIAGYKALNHPMAGSLGFITPNWINLVLLGLGIALHRRFAEFLHAVDDAISGAAGILIQFPLYFGIMGLMKSSGLITLMADFFVNVSTPETFPIYTFISAGLVNIFVPSGGGQWAVQGPIIVKAATEMGIPLQKCIMALAYGDQLTNMLQPFWALPLLGITGLKAKEILSYSVLLMLIGGTLFFTALWLL
ncbi:MAG: short-chain fatty acid transporter [Flavobacteriales bacterium]|nr:short-chain fatty acid transporter [Flavobacteriales bacterium]